MTKIPENFVLPLWQIKYIQKIKSNLVQNDSSHKQATQKKKKEKKTGHPVKEKYTQ